MGDRLRGRAVRRPVPPRDHPPRASPSHPARAALRDLAGHAQVRRHLRLAVPLSEQDVRAILQVIDEAPLAELRIETDGFSLHVIKGPAVESAPAPAPASAPAPAPASAPASAPAPTAVPSPAATGAPAPETSAPPDPSELVTV